MTTPWQIPELRHLRGERLSIRQERVFCEDRDRFVPVVLCAGCSSCAGVHLEGDESFVACEAHVHREAWLPTTLPPPLQRTPVSSVMKKAVAVAAPSMSLAEAAKVLVERAVGGLPVVDGDRILGVVSKSDLVAALARGAFEGTVGDIMTAPPLTLPKDAPVAQAAALMAHEGHHRILVIGDGGQLEGIVSSLDILRLMAIEDGYVVPSHTRAQRHLKSGS